MSIRPDRDMETLPSYVNVVENITAGRPDGLEQLYRIFSRLTIRFRRQFGPQDFEDRAHDIFLVVVDAIRDGRLREPLALAGYIQGIARLNFRTTIGTWSRHRRLVGSLIYWIRSSADSPGPQQALEQKERETMLRELLHSICERDREILTRFYLGDQTKEQICRALDLTDTQFRLAKSRAKQRLTKIVSAKLNHGLSVLS